MLKKWTLINNTTKIKASTNEYVFKKSSDSAQTPLGFDFCFFSLHQGRAQVEFMVSSVHICVCQIGEMKFLFLSTEMSQEINFCLLPEIVKRSSADF